MDYDDLDDIMLGHELTLEYVSRRVDDWFKRLNDLYASIRTWAAATGWSVGDGRPVPLHQEYMQKVGMPARDQPALSLQAPSGGRVQIRPEAPWTIGANGRINLYGSKAGLFVLIDIADEFAPPQWILHGDGKRREFKPELLGEMV